MLGLTADATFEELPAPDVVVFPGGVGTRPLQHDERVLDVGAPRPCRHPVHDVGLHGLARPRRRRACSRAHAPPPTGPATAELGRTRRRAHARRVVEHLDDRIITAAGVSSGIDMALRLVELLVDRTAAEAAQLMIEYDPQPPFDCGSVAKSDDAVMTRVIEYAALRASVTPRPGHFAPTALGVHGDRVDRRATVGAQSRRWIAVGCFGW